MPTMIGILVILFVIYEWLKLMPWEVVELHEVENLFLVFRGNYSKPFFMSSKCTILSLDAISGVKVVTKKQYGTMYYMVAVEFVSG